MSARRALVTTAIRVSMISVAWSLVVGIIAVVAGVVGHAIALVALGLESLIDGSASVMLVWRFGIEHRDADRARRVELVADRAIAVTLLVVAVYITAQAMHGLATGVEPEAAVVGIVIAAASIVVLPFLAVTKLRLARPLESAALRGDGVLTAAGAVLAFAVLLGFVANTVFGWWWADAVAALFIAVFLARDGWQTLSK